MTQTTLGCKEDALRFRPVQRSQESIGCHQPGKQSYAKKKWLALCLQYPNGQKWGFLVFLDFSIFLAIVVLPWVLEIFFEKLLVDFTANLKYFLFGVLEMRFYRKK